MKVHTQSVNFNADQKLIDFIQKRMDKLDLFFDKIIKSNVYLKVENTSEKENKIFEVQLSIPGDTIVVKKVSKTFEEGLDAAVLENNFLASHSRVYKISMSKKLRIPS